MPTTTRRKLLLTTLTVDIGCGSCRTPKLLRIFHPKPKPTTPTATVTKTQKPKNYTKIYHDNNNMDYSSTSFLDTDIKSTRTVKGFGRIGDESVAVEKDSGDPYLDFRHSMLQMILENEIYSKDDLRELLNCFLQLNSPCNHGIIIRAFTEIWNAVFSVRSGTSSLLLHFARSNRSRDY